MATHMVKGRNPGAYWHLLLNGMGADGRNAAACGSRPGQAGWAYEADEVVPGVQEVDCPKCVRAAADRLGWANW
jgi:hypothetical protein